MTDEFKVFLILKTGKEYAGHAENWWVHGNSIFGNVTWESNIPTETEITRLTLKHLYQEDNAFETNIFIYSLGKPSEE